MELGCNSGGSDEVDVATGYIFGDDGGRLRLGWICWRQGISGVRHGVDKDRISIPRGNLYDRSGSGDSYTRDGVDECGGRSSGAQCTFRSWADGIPGSRPRDSDFGEASAGAGLGGARELAGRWCHAGGPFSWFTWFPRGIKS